MGKPQKLSPEAVREIREWYTKLVQLPTGTDLAQKFNVSRGTIYGVARGLWHKPC